jgi:hypothetical protein
VSVKESQRPERLPTFKNNNCCGIIKSNNDAIRSIPDKGKVERIENVNTN